MFHALLSLSVLALGAAPPVPAAAAPAPTYFFCKLVPPRPAFAQSMTAAERAVMDRHVAYWRTQAKTGHVVIFGPVDDPAGAWGLLILEVKNEGEANQLTSEDPAITSKIGMHYEMRRMLKAIVPSRAAQ